MAAPPIATRIDATTSEEDRDPQHRRKRLGPLGPEPADDRPPPLATGPGDQHPGEALRAPAALPARLEAGERPSRPDRADRCDPRLERDPGVAKLGREQGDQRPPGPAVGLEQDGPAADRGGREQAAEVAGIADRDDVVGAEPERLGERRRR